MLIFNAIGVLLFVFTSLTHLLVAFRQKGKKTPMRLFSFFVFGNGRNLATLRREWAWSATAAGSGKRERTREKTGMGAGNRICEGRRECL